MYRLYARYRYRLKYSFDTDFYPSNCIQNTRNPIYRLYPRYRLKYSLDTDLSVKLYPEYKKANIQIVSKIQIQIEIQFLYRIFICQNTRNPMYRLYARYRYRLKYCFDTDFYPSNCIQNTSNPMYILYLRYRYRLKYSLDTEFLSIKLYPEYKKSNIQIVSKIQIQIEIQF